MLRQSTGAVNAHLILFLFQNRFQLATDDAVYSDGDKYRPAIAVADDLKSFLPSVKRVLMLGGGLGSMVYVLHDKGFNPDFTIVEIDKVVLKWAMELFENNTTGKIEPVCNDAESYMEQNKAKYDLLFVDVFNSRVVPEFVTSRKFLTQCYESLAPGGHCAINYIINDQQDWERVKELFASMFPKHKELNLGVNRVLVVCKSPAFAEAAAGK